jgi:hypothetical protein
MKDRRRELDSVDDIAATLRRPPRLVSDIP